MKKIILIILITFLIILTVGCKQKEIKVGGLTAKLEFYPTSEIIKSDSTIDVWVNLESKEIHDIDGRICIYDSPDDAQFGGIEGSACEDFKIPAVTEKGDAKTIDVKPVEATDIIYKKGSNLKSTSFTALIKYKKEETARSNPFCIRRYKDDPANKCNLLQKVYFQKYSVVKSLDKYLYDLKGDDNIIDLAVLEIVFEEDKDCTIIHPDLVNDFNLNADAEEYKEKEIYFEIELEQSGITLNSDSEECSIGKESTKNRKVIICEVNLDINQDFYENEQLITKFRYGCELPLISKIVEFNDKKEA